MDSCHYTRRQQALLRLDDHAGHPELLELCTTLAQKSPDAILSEPHQANPLNLDTCLMRVQYLEATLSEEILSDIERLWN